MNWLLQLFLAKYIECFTQFGPCPDKFRVALQELQNHPLYQKLPRDEYRKKFAEFTDVAQIDLYRRLPNTIVANIQMRKAVGIVKTDVVDAYGYVLGKATEKSNLPILESEFDAKALDYLIDITNLTDRSVRGHLDGSTLSVRLNNTILVLIDMQKDKNTWHSPLQAILNRSKIDGKFPQKIDLRFISPVVTY